MIPILSAIADRRSIRVFQNRPIEPDKIDALLEAARLAPSSLNLQHFRVIVAESPQDLAAVRGAAYLLPAFVSAPVVLVCMADVHADKDLLQRSNEIAAVTRKVDYAALRSGAGKAMSLKIGRDWALVNAAIATQNMVTQATAMGLGTCWNHHFEHDEVRAHYRLPDNIELLALVPVGYAAESPAQRLRRASVRWVSPSQSPEG